MDPSKHTIDPSHLDPSTRNKDSTHVQGREPLDTPLLVLGPAYSGKSLWARHTLDPERPALVIRTADDSSACVQAGSSTVKNLPTLWRAVSPGSDLTAILLDALGDEEQILVDCINQWIGRLVVEAGARSQSAVTGRLEELFRHLSLQKRNPHQRVTIVSAEAGASPPPAGHDERFFRLCLGITNQQLAAWCRSVVLVHAGLPLVIKAPLKINQPK